MYLCFGDANTGVGGDIGVFGGQEKDAGDEIGIDLSSVLTRFLPAPAQMDSDGLRWAQMGSVGSVAMMLTRIGVDKG